MNSFKFLFKGIPSKYTVLSIVSTLIWSSFNVCYVRLLSLLTKMFIEGDTTKLLYVGLGFIGYLLLWEITEFYADVLTYYVGTEIENYTADWFLQKTYKLKPSVIKRYNTGYLNGLCQHMSTNKEKTFTHMILYAPLGVIYILYSIFQLATYDIAYGTLLLLSVIISICFKILMRSKTNGYSKTLNTSESNRSKRTIDSISNIGTIQKMKSLDFIKSKLHEELFSCKHDTKNYAVSNELGFTGYKLIMYLFLPVVCLYYTFNPDSIADKYDFFSFLAVICVQIVHTAKNIANTITEFMRYSVTYEQVNSIYCDSNYRTELFDEYFKYAQIKNLNYKYYNSEKQITTEVKIPYFEVHRGDKIAIYGESGQGKTTLLNILSGELESDSVFINGLLTDKRLECVFISQDTEMLDMTLHENLVMGNNSITDDEIIYLLKACGLYEWFSRQTQGLDTPIGERGVFVSTGQRQRLNLIRGLLQKDGEIYLLDEPTSNVDGSTELEMVKVINDYLKTKTVVIVTHRHAIMSVCNKAYKFTDGVLGDVEKL